MTMTGASDATCGRCAQPVRSETIAINQTERTRNLLPKVKDEPRAELARLVALPEA